MRELIRREVRRQVERILNEAYERASQILHRAQLEVEDILNDYRLLADSTYTQSYHSFLSHYYSQARAKILRAQIEILASAKSEALEALRGVVEDRNRYRDVLKRLLEETVPHMGQNVSVLVNPRDADLMREILKELPQEWVLRPPKDVQMWNVDLSKWNVVEDEGVWAGLKVKDEDRNFILSNDLAERLEKAYQSMLESFRKEVEYVEK
ncbi:MAG: hypothetical protein GXO39_10000 [Thermotogae bacterium]|nr:hypothetical protein [Thermotogota bacterium]